MKKLNLLLTIILGITILSCTSDDENNNGNNSNLLGTWYGISSTLNGVNSGTPDSNILKFTSDNRVEFIYENFGNGNEDISEFGDWLENGNTLTIAWDDSDAGLENYDLEILELNESTLKWQTEITGVGTLIETFSTNQNATVDLSQFQDYIFEFEVVISGINQVEPYEYQVTLITTDGDNQIVEETETISGELNGTLSILTQKLVKEYKVVGIRIEEVTNNVSHFIVRLNKASNQNQVMNTYSIIPSSATITYDFETGTETITSE